MLITFKETLSWSRRAGVAAGKGVLIFGDGHVGQSLVRMASLLGAKPIAIVGPWAQRLDAARRLGADLVLNRKERPVFEACNERIADVVIDAVGNYDLLAEAFPLMRERAIYTVYGIPGTKRIAFDMDRAPREWSLKFFNMDEAETHEEVIELVQCGRLEPKQFYDRVLPMSQAAQAMELIASRKANKIVLVM